MPNQEAEPWTEETSGHKAGPAASCLQLNAPGSPTLTVQQDTWTWAHPTPPLVMLTNHLTICVLTLWPLGALMTLEGLLPEG